MWCLGACLLQVAVLLVLAVANSVGVTGASDEHCKYERSLSQRPHSVSITDFGAVGDGVTLNTLAFQNAIFYLRSFADKGGAQLYVPKGRWLTGSFNLTSHLTLFLDKDAVIIGTQVCFYNNWHGILLFLSCFFFPPLIMAYMPAWFLYTSQDCVKYYFGAFTLPRYYCRGTSWSWSANILI